MSAIKTPIPQATEAGVEKPLWRASAETHIPARAAREMARKNPAVPTGGV